MESAWSMLPRITAVIAVETELHCILIVSFVLRAKEQLNRTSHEHSLQTTQQNVA
jgi:hypothetical protein